jgi:hypothetical protein
MKNLSLLVLVTLLLPACLFGDEGHHHEDLTPEQLGTVHFATSCTPAAQKVFGRGVALLHSFWYEEAQKDFEDVAKSDPQCAMAHWGIAMSLWHQLWNHPDATTLARGLKEVKLGESLHAKTSRERAYIAAIGAFYQDSEHTNYQARANAYSQAMAKVHQDYSDDKEAAVFYALSLLASEPDNDTTFANRKQAAAVLEPLFASDPDHPGVAHYLIHSYDRPQLAALGLNAARRYARIAPAAPHALHMPSHIFARLGLWQDDIDSNLASIAATRKTAAMHMGGEGHQFHAMDFLVYAYLQSGREQDAQKVIEEVRSMPPTKDMYGMGFDPRADALTRFPAIYALELHHWKEAAALQPVRGTEVGETSTTYWARAIGAARSGDAAQAQQDTARIAAIYDKVRNDKDSELTGAVEHDRDEATAWAEYASGSKDKALTAMRGLAAKEEAEGDEPQGIPAREMVADMLLEMNQPAEALTEYETDLKFSPNRFDGLYGAARAAEQAGKTQEANAYYAKLVKICGAANSDRPELTHAKSLIAAK